MLIFTEYKHNDKSVYAVVVEKSNIGGVVQSLYENGYSDVYVRSVKLNDFISDSPSQSAMIAMKLDAPPQIIAIGEGYYVEEVDEEEEVINSYLIPRYEFGLLHSVVN